MTNSKIGKISQMAAGATVLVLFGCAYMSFGWTCPPGQPCHYGVRVEGIFCPDGGVAPTQALCPEPEIVLPDPPEEIGIYYTANHFLSINSVSQFGTMELYEDNVLDTIFNVQFNTIGNAQKIQNIGALQAAVLARMTSPSSQYSFNLQPPGVEVSTTANEGEVVSLTATMSADGDYISSTSTWYEAGPDGGHPSTSEEFGDP